MANMQMNKTPMPEQEPNVRNANFEEVALGYTLEQAQNEAQRCLNCKNKPCTSDRAVVTAVPAGKEETMRLLETPFFLCELVSAIKDLPPLDICAPRT